MIAHRDAAERAALVLTFAREPDFEIVTATDNVAEALARFDHMTPALVLLDWAFIGDDATGPLCASVRLHPATRLLFHHCPGNHGNSELCFLDETVAFAPRSSPPDNLVAVIRKLAAGRPRAAGTFPPHAPSGRVPRLTARELEILRMLVQGEANKEIAHRLCLAEVTVKQHLTRMFRKLGVRSRAGAVSLALTRGIVTEGFSLAR